MNTRPTLPIPSPRRARCDLRVGYVPLSHAAPLFAAKHFGFFHQEGLNVRLVREIGWATVREKIITGDLDAAQALGPMPLALSLGLGSHRVACISALVTNLNGNAIVVSRRWWDRMGGRLGNHRQTRTSSADPVTLAVVYPHSAHQFLLRRWCEQAGLMPDRDYRVVVIPPPQVVTHLRAGHIDGCCVGEPWATQAVRLGAGVVDALSADLAPGHPEKVLMARERFALERGQEHLALVRALVGAAEWCAQPAHHEALVDCLAHRENLALAPDILRPAISGQWDLGAGRREVRSDSLIFHGPHLNEPSLAIAQWLARQLGACVSDEFLSRVYRRDLYQAALVPAPSNLPEELTPIPIHAPLPLHELSTCPPR